MARSSFRRLVAKVAVGALAVVTPVALVPTAAQAAAGDLFLSEYIEGSSSSSSSKALEIYNGTGSAIDLAASSYSIQMFSNANTTAGVTINLTGTVAANDVYVVAQSASVSAVLEQADQTNGSGWYNGNDTVVLRKGTVVLDSIGQIASNPTTEWGSGLTSTADNTLRRKSTICVGDTDPTNAFDPAIEWDGYAADTFGGLGSHSASCGSEPPGDEAPSVSSITPANTGTAFPTVDASVTFSEPVNLATGAIALTCADAPVTAVVTGGPETFTVNPDADLEEGARCTLTVDKDLVTDLDATDPPDTMATDATSSFKVVPQCTAAPIEIGRIQGTEDLALGAGQVCTVSGVVVGDYEGAPPALRGFYVQDAGDGDSATSDGIFVFNGSSNSVALGDAVVVTGSVSEFQGQTQFGGGSTVTVTGTGTVEPTGVALPMDSATAYERYEGMLVTYPQTLYVTEHFQLGRFGQVVVSGGERLDQPTNVVAPGAPALSLQAANNLNKVIVDDASQVQNPDPIVFGRGGQPLSASNTLRGGDTIDDLTGVMTYTWAGNSASGNAFRVRPVQALAGEYDFQPANPRPTQRADVGGDVQVGAMNLLNYFNTFDGLPDATTGPNVVDNCSFGVGGAPADCRGADTQAEFDRQWPKTVAAIAKVDADVLGVNEIENDGYGPDSAIAHLVDKLNATPGVGPYAFINADTPANGVNALGTDAIKVGMIYKPSVVTPIGTTAVLNTAAFVNGGDNTARSRPSLAQAFEVNATGGTFVADVNHLKSKGSACAVPDAGDGQGNCNVVRTNAANELADWLADDPTGTGEDDTLILGDLNSYAKEDPIVALEEAGYTNLVAEHVGQDAYSYVFDGQWGYLDHALGSAGLLSQVTDVTEYHINADEPSALDYNTDFKSANLITSLYAPDEFRVSDHDPIVVGLSPTPAPLEAAFADDRVGCGDGNTSLTVTHPARYTGDTHAVSVDWGDGTPDSSASSASSPVTFGHTYTAAGVYTATATVTDEHGHTYSTTAEITVEYTSSGITAPFKNGSVTAKSGSTVPVKVDLRDCDGSEPTDLVPTVTVTSGSTIVRTGTMAYVDGTWLYELSTKGLAPGSYTVTVTVPETGQTDTGTLRVRR
ncbi:hypothetical protein GCM10023168_17460 [Fodinibacter luteus]|uniref:ExeM/NucH family extracellular endonuclease n=1 Tax=Fodinibacter luteus TaxID=552064 RepID=A0ABP8KDW3_9MICO